MKNKKILKVAGLILFSIVFYAAKLYFNIVKWMCLIILMTVFPMFGMYYITNNCWGKK